MRHVYVGDVGDFGKLGLLRALLHGADNEKLGVAWYLMDEDEHNNDGKHDSYLSVGSENFKSAFRNCDADLYDRLKQIRTSDQLNIALLEDGSVLPETTVFSKEPIPVKAKASARNQWHRRSRLLLKDCGIVFLDPDNGIKWEDPGKNANWSHKHAYWSEISDFLNAGMSVVIYHHLNMNCSHEKQIESALKKLLTNDRHGWAVRYRRGSSRVFFVIANENHRESFAKKLVAFGEKWSDHASLSSSMNWKSSGCINERRINFFSNLVDSIHTQRLKIDELAVKAAETGTRQNLKNKKNRQLLREQQDVAILGYLNLLDRLAFCIQNEDFVKLGWVTLDSDSEYGQMFRAGIQDYPKQIKNGFFTSLVSLSKIWTDE